jgi:hypothetical protein
MEIWISRPCVLDDRKFDLSRPKHGAGNVRVFGSVARGEARAGSDVDLLIDIVGKTTPWFPGSLLADLEKALGERMDIAIARSLNPLIKEQVLRDAIPL